MAKTVDVPGLGSVDFPDNMSNDEIAYAIRQNLKGQERQQNLSSLNARIGPEKNILSSAAHGGLDVAGGVAQLVGRAGEAMGMPKGTNLPFVASPEIVDQSIAQARQAVTSKLGEPNSPLTRAVSGGALTVPFTPMKAAVMAPTWLGRAGFSGLGGGVSAAMQEVPNATSPMDFAQKKALQTGVGGVTAALASPVAEGVIKGGVALANAGANKAATIARGQLGTNELVALTRESLKKSGLDYDSLDEGIKQKLLGDVQTALSSSPSVDPGAVARQAAFRQERFNPLQHWVTKDPAQWTQNENLAGLAAGDPLKQQKAALDRLVIDRLNEIRGQPKVDPSTLGGMAQRDLAGWLKNQDARTNVLYRSGREIAPTDIVGEPQRFANRLFGTLEGQGMMGSLPAGAREWANGISSGKIPLNAQTIPEMIQAANKLHGNDPATNKALAHFKQALDDELAAISEQAVSRGGEARFTKDAFDMARKQAAGVFGEIDSNSALAAVKKGDFTPERFFQDYVNNNSVSLKELASTWSKLGGDTRDALRAKMVDAIKAKAFGGASDESGKSAAQAQLNNWIAQDGMDQRLKIVLGDKGYQQVKRLGLMLESGHLVPSGSKASSSNSNPIAAALSGPMGLATGYKNLGLPGGAGVTHMAGKGAAELAMRNDPAQMGARSVVISPEWEEFIKRFGGGLLGLPAAAGTSGLLGGN